ncbi:hypothetical protein BRAS3843_700027 [Bradyrhizobium sp. STM 3843]|nr:hypothetical protein BRAS3843_700027 [Bradyrhizobium sp. STM 3843]
MLDENPGLGRLWKVAGKVPVRASVVNDTARAPSLTSPLLHLSPFRTAYGAEFLCCTAKAG